MAESATPSAIRLPLDTPQGLNIKKILRSSYRLFVHEQVVQPKD